MNPCLRIQGHLTESKLVVYSKLRMIVILFVTDPVLIFYFDLELSSTTTITSVLQ